MKKNRAEIFLPYVSPGTDFSFAMDTSDRNVPSALRVHAELLENIGTLLRQIEEILVKSGQEGFSVEIDANRILLSGPTEVIEELLELDFVQKDSPFEENLDYWQEGDQF